MNYPESAGAQNVKTSLAAADALEKSGRRLSRERIVYNALERKPRTRWELVDDLGLAYEAINPRCSTMKTRGLLEPTGETRKGRHGMAGEVLRVCAPYSPQVTKAAVVAKFQAVACELSVDQVEGLKTALAHLQLSMCGHAMKAETILAALIKKL